MAVSTGVGADVGTEVGDDCSIIVHPVSKNNKIQNEMNFLYDMGHFSLFSQIPGLK
jgi:hypothetical protein